MLDTELESYRLKAIKIIRQGQETLLGFSKAILFVDTSDIQLSWFIDITEMDDVDLLHELANSTDIRIMMYGRTDSELEIAGEAHIHPNLSFACAAIKGDGELIGYEQIKEAAIDLC